MRKSAIVLILYSCCSPLGAFSPVGTVNAAPADAQPAITVIGTGEVFRKPDMARINVGVVTQRESASASLRRNTEAMEKVLATLDQHNIAESDIQTNNFSISPRYDYDRAGQPPRLIGYRVSNRLRIVVRDLERLGALLDEVIAAGSNQINEVVFEIDEIEALEDAARRMAVSDARRKATLYAQEAGVRLGTVLTVAEIAGPAPVPQTGITMAHEARAVPIAPGRRMVKQSVSVTFAIDTNE